MIFKNPIFLFNKSKVYSMLNNLMSLDINKINLLADRIEKDIILLSKIEKKNKKLNVEEVFYDSIFSQTKIKLYNLMNDNKKSGLLIQNNKDFILNNRKHLNKKNITLFSIFNEYLDFENQTNVWNKSIEEVLKERIRKMELNENEDRNILNILNNLEINSEEYLKLNEQRIELKFENIKFKTSSLLENELILINNGKSLQLKINLIKNKILNSGLIGSKNDKNIYYKKSSKTLIDIYNKLLISDLKIDFYLNKTPEYLFYKVQKIIISLINSRIKDPLLYIKNNHIFTIDKNNFKHYRIESIFDFYLNTFSLSIKKSSKSNNIINLKQFNIPVNEI